MGIVLSSAYFGFYAHTGFMKAIKETGLKIGAYSGSSSGSLIAALSACETLDQITPSLLQLRRRDFWDPSVQVGRPWGLLKGRKLQGLIEQYLPVDTFEDCTTPLVTVCTNLETGRRHVDDHGPLAPAIASSCALPFLFQPISRRGVRFSDGGIIDKAPIEALIRHHKLDALVVHIIHSKSIGKKAPSAPRRFLNWSLDQCRQSAWQSQALLAEAMGVETYIVESEPASIGPFTMGRGQQILQRQTIQVQDQLKQPSHLFRASYLLS
ncbi:MAG: patatin-like phospholipase family protein [Myxococcota bacterium]|nr:patatin-like phospholipase family protein [Myxococcota bacterium]